MKRGRKSLVSLKEDFEKLRSKEGEEIIKEKTRYLDEDGVVHFKKWYELSKEADQVYPSQGILLTAYDFLDVRGLQMLPQSQIIKTLRMRRYFLELFNHPYRLNFLEQVNKKKYQKTIKVTSVSMERAEEHGLALAVGDLGSIVVGASRERVSRSERYAQGPFIKLGRQARSIFVGSSSPDVWNSAQAIATMAASHCLTCIPRNGLTSDAKRQTDLASEIYQTLDELSEEILAKRRDRNRILDYWRRNVIGTLDANPEKAVVRASALWKVGVRGFRIYSPEPGTGVVETVKLLRKVFGQEVEIFAGQIVEVDQGKEAAKAGADGLFIGIGGGGRCITGIRSGSAIDWPELVWKLRGEIGIPVIVEGGASDHVAITLLLGASGISVSRVVAGGTIESPGGALFCVDEKGKLFKPYGGEASARAKFLDGKVLPFEIPSFVEGETTKAEMNYVKWAYPTLTYNLHLLQEDAILAMVFRGVKSIEELHQIDPSPLRQITASGDFQRKTH